MRAYYLENEEFNVFAVATGDDNETLAKAVANAVKEEFCIESEIEVTLSGGGEGDTKPFTASCEYINDEGDEESREFTLFNTFVY